MDINHKKSVVVIGGGLPSEMRMLGKMCSKAVHFTEQADESFAFVFHRTDRCYRSVS